MKTDEKNIALKLLYCLRELVDLKELKDTQGKTVEYNQRQPLVWSTAKKLVHQYKYFGVKAESTPSLNEGGKELEEAAKEWRDDNAKFVYDDQGAIMLMKSFIAGAKWKEGDAETTIEKMGNESLVFEMDLLRAKEEIERLKELIQKAHSEGYEDAMHHIEYYKSIKEFKTENNL